MGKKRISLILALVLALAPVLTACGSAGGSGADVPEDGTIVLRVGNWEEYIDQGGWSDDEAITLEDGTTIKGEDAVITEYERWFEENYHKKVRVEYATFGTNEDLYNQLTLRDNYDVVCPSEYMIMKLMDEGRLQPFSDGFFDTGDSRNYYVNGVSPYIAGIFKKLNRGGKPLERYAAGYMWGTLGFVYNPEEVSEADASDWNILRNPAYSKRITVKDSVRDTLFAGVSMLKQDQLESAAFKGRSDYSDALSRELNDTSQATVDKVEDILSQVKDNVYSFETDSGKSDMITGKVVVNQQWSGDAVYTISQAAEEGVTLQYAVPSADTNLWFDGWCMLKNGIGADKDKQQAAEAFINFLSRPDIAIRNMNTIGYTSVIAGGQSPLIYDYVKWQYGADSEAAASGETAVYPLGTFFSGNDGDDRYKLVTDAAQLKGQLYAQYPPQAVIGRSVVMGCFSTEENERISRMWVNVRCPDIRQMFAF